MPHRRGKNGRSPGARWLEERRRERGLTQAGLGARVRRGQQSVSRWETGQDRPEPAVWAPLADALGVTVPELILRLFPEGTSRREVAHGGEDRPTAGPPDFFFTFPRPDGRWI